MPRIVQQRRSAVDDAANRPSNLEMAQMMGLDQRVEWALAELEITQRRLLARVVLSDQEYSGGCGGSDHVVRERLTQTPGGLRENGCPLGECVNRGTEHSVVGDGCSETVGDERLLDGTKIHIEQALVANGLGAT